MNTTMKYDPKLGTHEAFLIVKAQRAARAARCIAQSEAVRAYAAEYGTLPNRDELAAYVSA